MVGSCTCCHGRDSCSCRDWAQTEHWFKLFICSTDLMLLQGRRSKLAPQRSEQDTQAAQTPAPAAVDQASPLPASAAAAAAPPASELDAAKTPSSGTLSDSAPAVQDMERAALASTASPARMVSSDPQPQSSQESDRQAAASPVAAASAVLHPEQPGEPCVSGTDILFGSAHPGLLWSRCISTICLPVAVPCAFDWHSSAIDTANSVTLFHHDTQHRQACMCGSPRSIGSRK